MVVRQDGNNCLAEVADFPQYGTGLGGWRDRLVVATTARARERGTFRVTRNPSVPTCHHARN